MDFAQLYLERARVGRVKSYKAPNNSQRKKHTYDAGELVLSRHFVRCDITVNFERSGEDQLGTARIQLLPIYNKHKPDARDKFISPHARGMK